jgi:hypothetical protein
MANDPENAGAQDGTPEVAAKPREFTIQIDKTEYKLTNPTPTGRDLLILAGKNPPDKFAIYLKVKGGQPQRVELNQQVDLRDPGVEKFVTLPLDQTEGTR